MKTVAIAMMCHAMNAAYYQSLGDDSQPIWDNAPDAQKQGIISGVEMYIANPDVTPEQNHEVWYQQKQAEGWAYGKVLDPENKLHPCFLPYEELPQAQKSKDYLFRAIVHLVKNLPDPEDYLALSAEVVSLRQKAEQQKHTAISTATPSTATTSTTSGGIAIQYVGNKSLFKDHLYNSALTFTVGQVRTVSSDLATLFLSVRLNYCNKWMQTFSIN
ncbi:RyR domain-containing protein [Acinetobacter sp. ANC 5383]